VFKQHGRSLIESNVEMGRERLIVQARRFCGTTKEAIELSHAPGRRMSGSE